MSTTAEQHVPRRNDLSRLVREQRAELRLSLRAVAALTADLETGEHLVKYGTLNRLEKEEEDVTPFSLPQLEALATALELPFGLIQEAAGSQFLGIYTLWSEDGDVRALVHDYRELEPEDQEKARALMSSWRKLKRD